VTPDVETLRLLVRFDNVGRSPVQSVAVVFDFAYSEFDDPVEVVPGSVRLFNANYEDGYAYGDPAIQANGNQINVGAGTYVGGSNFYIEPT
jgi:hypothetical protein